MNYNNLKLYIVGDGSEEVIATIKKSSFNYEPGLLIISAIIRLQMLSTAIAKSIKSDNRTLFKIITGEKKITQKLATRLGIVTRLGVKFWLDVQTKQELLLLLKITHEDFAATDSSLFNYFKRSLAHPSITNETKSLSKLPLHPGIIMYTCHIRKTGINACDWANYFNITAERFNKMMEGKSLFTLDFIMNFSKTFNNRPEYWIEKQNTFNAIRLFKIEKDKIKPVATKVYKYVYRPYYPKR